MTPKRRLFLARIAMFAMLWQGLVLPLSTAIAASTGKPGEVPICTATGIKWVKAGDLPGTEQRQDGQAHCPLCVLSQDTPALVGRHASYASLLASAFETRIAFAATLSSGLSSAAPPPARAPPFIS